VSPAPKKSHLHRWILGGLALGLAAGLAANYLTEGREEARETLAAAVNEVVRPVGTIFLRLLFMTVIPLVFSCLALGVYGLGGLRELGRVGLKTFIATLVLSGVSVAIGLALVNSVQPGRGISPEARERLERQASVDDRERAKKAETEGGLTFPKLVETLIPRNPVEAAARAFDGDMIGFLVFALLFGIALRASGSARAAPVAAVLEGVYDASMWLVGFALRLAPLGVAALVFAMAASMGSEILKILAGYVLTVLVGLGIQLLVVYPLILRFACGLSPVAFLSRIREVLVTAFSTSSSNATLPTTIRVAKGRLGIPAHVADFVLTLGSTLNQNGTALFEGVTLLFLAQLYGVPLDLGQQALVIALSVIAGIGTAGVPSGSIPLLVPILVSLGVPGEGIVIILGVDRFLDMCRTVLNVTGDMVIAAFIARGEGADLLPPESSRDAAAAG